MLIQLYDRPRDEASLDVVEADRGLKNATFGLTNKLDRGMAFDKLTPA